MLDEDLLVVGSFLKQIEIKREREGLRRSNDEEMAMVIP